MQTIDRGRLAIIQPLLVMTVVFALPLGYVLTSQAVGRREVIGSGVIVLGLALFAIYVIPPEVARRHPAASGRLRSPSW